MSKSYMNKRSLKKVVIKYQTTYIDVINTRYQKFDRTFRGWILKKKIDDNNGDDNGEALWLHFLYIAYRIIGPGSPGSAHYDRTAQFG